jgi:hypothetical protein
MTLKKAIKRKIIDALPTRWHIAFDFVRAHGHLPSLDSPKSFSEKIQWRKLHEFDARMPDLVDKVKAKQFVAKQFGEKYIIPTLAVYNSADELDFTKPPLSQPPYVLKANHGSGLNIFVKELPIDADAIKKKLAGFLKLDYEKVLEEWAYSEVDRKILVEPFVDAPQGYIPDYKFHVFNGTTYAIELVIDRFKDYWINFFDRNWKRIDVKKYAKRPPYQGEVKPPAKYAEMLTLAEGLAAGFPYVRVDLYDVNGDVKFGEMTFYPGSGYDRFDPPEWDQKFGEQWHTGTARRGK